MRKNTIAMFGIAFLCMIYMSGCSNQSNQNPDLKATGSVTVTTPAGDDQGELSLESISEYQELSIYSIDALSQEKIAVTAVVAADKELTPQLIVDKVVESMADETFVIGIDEVTTQEDTIIVSFLDDQPPVANIDSNVESEILDAIAQSLLDNLTEYHKVCYRVMGGAYQSADLSFDINQIYLETH